MIIIVANTLFALENNNLILNKLNPDLEKFINYSYKNGSLKYDIQNKLGKAIIKEMLNIDEFRQKLISENPRHTQDNCEMVNKQIHDLLNSEIEIDAAPISLSKLIDDDCSSFNFAVLDKFIIDDRV